MLPVKKTNREKLLSDISKMLGIEEFEAEAYRLNIHEQGDSSTFEYLGARRDGDLRTEIKLTITAKPLDGERSGSDGDDD